MNKNTKTKDYNYTKIQYFFWLFSGAEINILKDCPTDYNRQAGIGFTIFMTTLFAMFAGGYAGYYFSKSWTIAVIFAVIWGLLIFSIDRTLVVTLKKDPDKPKQNFWMQFLGRAVLAGLIAFIISIPLELLIFRDKIEEQKMLDKETTIIEYRDLMGSSKGIYTDEKSESLATNIAIQARENAKNCATDPIYSDLENQRKLIEPDFKRKKNIRDNAINKYNSYLRNDQPNTAAQYKASTTYKNAMYNYNAISKKYQEIVNEQNKRCSDYIKEQNKIANEQQLNAAELNKGIVEKNKIADKMATKLDSLQQESFIRDYIALENAAKRKVSVIKDSVRVNIGTKDIPEYKIDYIKDTKYANDGMNFFLWLVRILFFTIEILPTLAKMVTPAGAYDRAIKKREDDYVLELEERTTDYLLMKKKYRIKQQEYKDLLDKDRNEIERKLQKDILEKVAEAQNEIAKIKIEDFKKKHT